MTIYKSVAHLLSPQRSTTICWLQLLYERKMAIADTITRTNCAVDSLMDIRIRCALCIFWTVASVFQLQRITLYFPYLEYIYVWSFFLASVSYCFLSFIFFTLGSVIPTRIVGAPVNNWMKFYASGFLVITFHTAKQMKSDQLSTRMHTHTHTDNGIRDRDEPNCIDCCIMHSVAPGKPCLHCQCIPICF